MHTHFILKVAKNFLQIYIIYIFIVYVYIYILYITNGTLNLAIAFKIHSEIQFLHL